MCSQPDSFSTCFLFFSMKSACHFVHAPVFYEGLPNEHSAFDECITLFSRLRGTCCSQNRATKDLKMGGRPPLGDTCQVVAIRGPQ